MRGYLSYGWCCELGAGLDGGFGDEKKAWLLPRELQELGTNILGPGWAPVSLLLALCIITLKAWGAFGRWESGRK